MRHVHDDAEAVHLGDDGVTELRDASIVRFARAIADGISSVVSQMHHAHAELLENADEPQLIAHTLPLLAERHAVGGEISSLKSVSSASLAPASTAALNFSPSTAARGAKP